MPVCESRKIRYISHQQWCTIFCCKLVACYEWQNHIVVAMFTPELKCPECAHILMCHMCCFHKCKCFWNIINALFQIDTSPLERRHCCSICSVKVHYDWTHLNIDGITGWQLCTDVDLIMGLLNSSGFAYCTAVMGKPFQHWITCCIVGWKLLKNKVFYVAVQWRPNIYEQVEDHMTSDETHR